MEIMIPPALLPGEDEDWLNLRSSIWNWKISLTALILCQREYSRLVSKAAEVARLGVDLKDTAIPHQLNMVKSEIVHKTSGLVLPSFGGIWSTSLDESKLRQIRGIYSEKVKPKVFWGTVEPSSVECLVRSTGRYLELFTGLVDVKMGNGSFYQRCIDADELEEASRFEFVGEFVTEAFSDPDHFEDSVRELARWMSDNVDVPTEIVYSIVNEEIIHSFSQVGGEGTSPAREKQVQVDFAKLDAETPDLDTKSVEWIVARAKNEKKLGLPIKTLKEYRHQSKGGRTSLCKMFGVDKDRRFWRRQGTQRSAVYYLASTLPQNR